MLKQIEGSQAIADAISLCRPEVICAYPITPQTHIVEGLGERVKAGHLKNCEYINVESEFAAMSVAIGASAAGARSYTATSSQGLLFMAEAVYNASGLGLPIVMTLGNRAIGAPINIWNDHSDAMALRDAGWIQLFAETNQEAVDLHIQAFKLAESISCPVMVCVDGFILTHAFERVDIPTQKQVDSFLPPFKPTQMLDVAAPISIGPLVGPEAFTEVRYLEHQKQYRALELIPQIASSFKEAFGRESGGLIRSYKTEDADTVIVAMGAIVGTAKDVVDEEREHGNKVGIVSICSFRPFPSAEIRKALHKARRIIVLERSLAPGQPGILASHVRLAIDAKIPVITLISGLGGRPVMKNQLHEFLSRPALDLSIDAHFLGLKEELIADQLSCLAAQTPKNTSNHKTNMKKSARAQRK